MTQPSWLLPAGVARNYRSGFLGRLSETLTQAQVNVSPIAFTDALPLSFQGTVPVPNLSLENVGRPAFDQRQAGILDSMHAGHPLQEAVEGGAQGALATNLASLGSALQLFAQTLGDEWNSTVVVLSEFGRTFREYGNRGTDHGHGTACWVLGGSISGGRIAREQQRLERSTPFQDRDYPVLNDYRAVLAGLFRTLWGLSREQCQRVFPQAEPLGLGLV